MSIDIGSTAAVTLEDLSPRGFWAMYPMTVMMWIKPISGSGNGNAVQSVDTGGGATRLIQVRAGGSLRMRTADTGVSNMEITHGHDDEWFVIMCKWLSSTSRTFSIYYLDGDSDTSTTTNSVTEADPIDQFNFFAGSADAYVEHCAIWMDDLPSEMAWRMSRGEHPLSFIKYRNALALYQPFVSGYNQFYAQGVPMSPTASSPIVVDDFSPSRVFQFPVLWLPATQDDVAETTMSAQGEGFGLGSANLTLEVPDVNIQDAPGEGFALGSTNLTLEVPDVNIQDAPGAGDVLAQANFIVEEAVTNATTQGEGFALGSTNLTLEVPDVNIQDAPGMGDVLASANAISILITDSGYATGFPLDKVLATGTLLKSKSTGALLKSLAKGADLTGKNNV